MNLTGTQQPRMMRAPLPASTNTRPDKKKLM